MKKLLLGILTQICVLGALPLAAIQLTSCDNSDEITFSYSNTDGTKSTTIEYGYKLYIEASSSYSGAYTWTTPSSEDGISFNVSGQNNKQLEIVNESTLSNSQFFSNISVSIDNNDKKCSAITCKNNQEPVPTNECTVTTTTGAKFVSIEDDGEFAKSLSDADTADIIIKTENGEHSISRNGIAGITFENDGTLTQMPDYFLCNFASFNKALTLPSLLVSTGDHFMNGCTSFDSKLTISNTTSIGDYFMTSCSSFNKPLTLPSSVTSIGNYFMSGCTAFYQSLTLPNSIISIGTHFMFECTSMYNWSNMIGINIGTIPATAFATGGVYDKFTLSTTTDISGVGYISIFGMYSYDFYERFPERDSSPYRRFGQF